MLGLFGLSENKLPVREGRSIFLYTNVNPNAVSHIIYKEQNNKTPFNK